jgi:hypothetical protein
MGNSQTKEARGQQPQRTSGTVSPAPRQEPPTVSVDTTTRPSASSRPGRTSRPEFSFLGIGGNSDQDASSLETRRENKQEREARKAEKERQARLKERERSMKEEHVDGGYLATQGVYVGPEDFSKLTVRQLMVWGTRRMEIFLLTLLDREKTCALLEGFERLLRVVGGASTDGCRAGLTYPSSGPGASRA